MPGFLIGIEPGEQGVAVPNEPVYSYTWQIDQLMGINARNFPLIYVKDCTLPDYTFEQEEGPGSSLKYKYAKGISWSDVKMTFYEVKGTVAKLEELKRKIWTPEGGLGIAVDYKFESAITQFTADDFHVSQRLILKGSWLKGLSYSNLTYTNSDVHNVTATIAYDWAEFVSG